MSAPLQAELKLSNDPLAPRVAKSLVRELAELAELAEGEQQALAAAAGAACDNILRYAFEPGEDGTFTVAGELDAAALTLSFLDQGPPVGPELESARLGHGLARIREAVDELHWIQHGREGKELRLVKRRPAVHVTDQLSARQLTPLRHDEPVAPPQEYVVRRFEPEDALGIARCVYRVYGYSYQHEELYYPERIVQLNESGQLVSIVALDAAGEVVGHYALERPERVPVAERGEAFVSPAHRGRGLMERMRPLIEAEAQRLELAGTFGNAVTTHPYSQLASEKAGARPCGITLGLLPRSVTFKKIASEPLAQRVSCVLGHQLHRPPALRVVHVPTHHRALLERIYGALAIPVEFGAPAAPEGAGSLATQYRPAYEVGVIRVRRVGADSAAAVRQALRDLRDLSGAAAIYLELPLAQPGAPELCAAAEAAGFFFSGLGPDFAADGDVLRLQYLTEPLDAAQLKIATPFAQELTDYAFAEWARVAPAAADAS